MTDSVGLDLAPELDVPSLAEGNLSGSPEAVIASVGHGFVIRWASRDIGGISLTGGNERVVELTSRYSVIAIGVVAFHPEVKFFACWEDTDRVQAALDVGVRKVAIAPGVKDFERVNQVEVVLTSEIVLLVFDLTFYSDETTDADDKLVFVSGI